jgi:hypothetical protein
MNTTPNTFPTDATDIDRLARRRVGARLGWLTHASIYLLVMGGLTAMALWQGRHPPVAAAFGWGLGLTIHGLRVFVAGKGSALRERLVDAERQRLIAGRRA